MPDRIPVFRLPLSLLGYVAEDGTDLPDTVFRWAVTEQNSPHCAHVTTFDSEEEARGYAESLHADEPTVES